MVPVIQGSVCLRVTERIKRLRGNQIHQENSWRWCGTIREVDYYYKDGVHTVIKMACITYVWIE